MGCYPVAVVRLLTLAALLAQMFVGAPFACADGWDDAKKEFRREMKSDDWKVRREAFLIAAEYDGADAAREILEVIDDEPNAAVVLAGIDTLALFRSDGALEGLREVAAKGRGRQQLLALVTMSRLKDPSVVSETLVKVAGGRDAQAVCQAVLALGASTQRDATELLIDLLGHKAWQVRAAAARTLALWDAEEAIPALAKALPSADGRARGDIVQALEAISDQKFGNDPDAWEQLAEGADPDTITAKPELAPTAFGIPIYGERLVICLDNSLRMGDPHAFSTERLRELTDPKDGKPIAWFRMKTNGQFAHGHVKHLVDGLPRGTRFEIITFNASVNPVFGKLMPVSTASRQTAFETIDGLITDDGINAYGALTDALDIGGSKDDSAWKSGPDEIIYITVNQPTTGEVVEADVVAAAIALKARLRMVPIHTVGIHFHPYDMCRLIAERTGGTYMSLVE